jgi:hypothetical protein
MERPHIDDYHEFCQVHEVEIKEWNRYVGPTYLPRLNTYLGR